MPSKQVIPRVQCIAITGGIASGKSFICTKIEAAGHRIFYCDPVAKHIIRTDPEVRKQLVALIGSELYDKDGMLVKPVLARWLCRGKTYSSQVDAIVHPRVAEAFRQQVEACPLPPASVKFPPLPIPACPTPILLDNLIQLPPQSVQFMECALLFESGFDRLVDLSVNIHVSREMQLRRLIERDKISPTQAQAWLDLQLSEPERLSRCNYYLINE